MVILRRIATGCITAALVAALGAWQSNTISAHEESAHVDLTSQAINYLMSVQPQLRACGTDQVRTALAQGAEQEDAWIDKPLGRFFFHFLPRLVDTFDVSFNFGSTELPLGQFTAVASCSSATWGFGSAGCEASVNTPAEVGPMFSAALRIPPQPAGRYQEMLAALRNHDGGDKYQGQVNLGRVVHLLQDLTSPPHTRNDAHPHKGFMDMAHVGDPSAFEVVNAHRGFSILLSRLGGLLPQLSSPEDAFQTLQRFTSSHYHSEKTITFEEFAIPPAVGLTSDGQYAVDMDGRKLWRYSADTHEPFIDDVIAREQFDELGPLAVMYTAALINFIHWNVVDVCDEALNVVVVGNGQVQGATLEASPKPVQEIMCVGNPSGATCRKFFGSGREVTLVASPTQSRTQFARWETDPPNACDDAANPQCEILMDDVPPKTAWAHFRNIYTVSVVLHERCRS